MVFSLSDLEKSRGVVDRSQPNDIRKITNVTTGWSPTEDRIEGVKRIDPLTVREAARESREVSMTFVKRHPFYTAAAGLVLGFILGRVSKRSNVR